MKVNLKLLLMLPVFTMFIQVNAQTTVNNAGFEDWDNLGSNTEEPSQWNSFKSAQGAYSTFGAQQVKRSGLTRPGSTGTYSAVIWCRDATLAMANGDLTCGRINMGNTSPTSSSNYNLTLTSNTAYNEAFTAHPDSLVVWVRTNISNTSHQPRIHAIIHDNYDVRDPVNSASSSHIVAEATLNFTPVNSVWERKSIPFVYSGPSTTHNYILISFTTCKDPGTGTEGDSLYIDDLQFIYNPVLTTGAINPTTYLVTATTSASIDIPFTLTGTMNPGNIVTAQLSDATGSFASPVVLGTLASTTSGTINGTIPAATITGGGYRIRVISSDYALTAADNGTDIVISDVTGISSILSEKTLIYWENSQLHINLNENGISNPAFNLYDINGKLIMRTNLTNFTDNSFELNIPAGIFIYNITSGEKIISGKIIKLK